MLGHISKTLYGHDIVVFFIIFIAIIATFGAGSALIITKWKMLGKLINSGRV